MARLHLPALNAQLTELTTEQGECVRCCAACVRLCSRSSRAAEYLKVSKNGPFKPANYRY